MTADSNTDRSTLDANIRVDFPALRLDVQLSVAAGEVLGLVGPNGSGKTTILRAIAGLQPLAAGRIHINGVVVDDPQAEVHIAPQDRRVGVVFQDYRLFPHLSARDNVAFGLRCNGKRRADARRIADEWIERVELGAHRDHRPNALSGGQAQKVALARSLAVEPDVLLLDEPLAAVDPGTRTSLGEDLGRYLASFSGATVMVSHDREEIRARTNRVIVIQAGRATWTGPSADLR